MTERDWDKFFELIGKIVDEGKPVNEKTAEAIRQAKARGETEANNFEEFTAWDFSLYYD